MPCGCISSCGCQLLCGAGLLCGKVGDTLTLSLVLANTDCVALATVGAALTADLILDPDADCVTLSCSASGLRADLVIDPEDTCVDLSCSEDGLRADLEIDPAASEVELTCGPDGVSASLNITDGDTVDLEIVADSLTAEVIVDPDSTADVSISGDGLRIDIPAGPGAGFVTLDTDQTITGIKTFAAAPRGAVQVFTTSGTILDTGGQYVTYEGAAGQILDLPPAVVGSEFEIHNYNTNFAANIQISADVGDDFNETAVTDILVVPVGMVKLECHVAGSWRTIWPAFQQVADGYASANTDSSGAGDKLTFTVAGDGATPMLLKSQISATTTSAGANLFSDIRTAAAGGGTIVARALQYAPAAAATQRLITEGTFPAFTANQAFFLNLQSTLAGTPSSNEAAAGTRRTLRAVWAPGMPTN